MADVSRNTVDKLLREAGEACLVSASSVMKFGLSFTPRKRM